MRILLGYHYYPNYVDTKSVVEARLARLRHAGIDVHPFVLTLKPPGRRLTWKELDARWKRGDRELLQMYERLANECQNHDVFINWNGINVHPEFVSQLPTFNIYGCYDDPEATEDLSKPVAAAFDLSMIGNIAEVETYKSWGVRHAEFWPYGFRVNDYDPTLTTEKILTGERDVEISLLCERETPWRRERLDRIAAAFPQGHFHGRGWPRGILPEEARVPLYQRTKVGINFHHTTGPINLRCYALPANGVMQICDNKSHLGKIYELGREVAGFDKIDEAIDLARYYLAHNDERRRIAAAGFERVIRDYNEVSVFRLVEKYAVPLLAQKTKVAKDTAPIFLSNQRRKTSVRRACHAAMTPVRRLACVAKAGVHRAAIVVGKMLIRDAEKRRRIGNRLFAGK